LLFQSQGALVHASQQHLPPKQRQVEHPSLLMPAWPIPSPLARPWIYTFFSSFSFSFSVDPGTVAVVRGSHAHQILRNRFRSFESSSWSFHLHHPPHQGPEQNKKLPAAPTPAPVTVKVSRIRSSVPDPSDIIEKRAKYSRNPVRPVHAILSPDAMLNDSKKRGRERVKEGDR
jgi:hypothetical protein